MEYITTKEASQRWGISTIRITVLANEGRIPGAQRLGKRWLIPATATKPQELKPNHYHSAPKEETDNFSFPLYHFRPDWSYISKDKLTEQEGQLLEAESAMLECRFNDAYTMLENIMQAPENIAIEIGCLFNIGMCCITLNKPKDFDKIFFRLRAIMSEDFPHRDDLMLVFDFLKTYTDTVATVANEYKYRTDIHDQCLPTACLLTMFSLLTKEMMELNSIDVNLFELNLRLIKSTSAVIVAEFMHIYLLGIYYMRNEISKAEKHAKIAVQLAYENKYYFPLATYYRYYVPVLAPAVENYPEEFQNHIVKLASKYDENFTAFFSSMGEYSLMSNLKDTDFPYIYAVLMNLSNAEIAKRTNVSQTTIKRRYEAIFKKLNVGSKKELKEFLIKNI